MVAEEKLKMCKVRLGQLNSMFENFNLEEIKSKKKSKELAEQLKSISEEYRRELLGRKTFELKTKYIKMEEVFGTLKIEDVSLQIEVKILL